MTTTEPTSTTTETTANPATAQPAADAGAPAAGKGSAAAGARGRVRVEQAHKRIRPLLGGVVVVDTVRPLLVWEGPHYPVYYLPLADLKATLESTGEVVRSPSRGDAHRHDVVAGEHRAAGAALTYPDSPFPELRDMVRLDWDAFDTWLEEDEPVYVHARNPFHRVDILSSSRHVRVEIDGVTVAESTRPTVLFETNIRPRYYLPLTDVRTELLRPSSTSTGCPYKGTASYYGVEVDGKVHDDVVWYYPAPLLESIRIAGFVCFYDEKVDVYVDGVHT
jgi:uncharacterized protein (DUF427 family)